MIRTLAVAAAAASVLLAPQAALAWGNMGHRLVGEAAILSLPAELPAWVRTADAMRDVGEYSREQDRAKGAGKVHDHNRDAGHFLDLDDQGSILGGPPFLPLPATRADYEKALQAKGLNSWDAGYLPYSIIDQHQQLVKDFGYWRAAVAGAKFEKDKAKRAWLTRDAQRRRAQVLQTIGHLSHFVGDGSQPMHVTVHYNGWGDYPNPKGYSTAKLHGPFESEFVFANVSLPMVRAKMTPAKGFDGDLEARTTGYLQTTAGFVEPFYALEKAGGLTPGDARGKAFASERLAAGASELRDHIVAAWRESATTKVGWPAVVVSDVETGKASAYIPLYGKD